MIHIRKISFVNIKIHLLTNSDRLKAMEYIQKGMH